MLYFLLQVIPACLQMRNPMASDSLNNKIIDTIICTSLLGLLWLGAQSWVHTKYWDSR